MGRKTLLTDKLSEKVCVSIKIGVSIETACANAGIGKSTLYDWLHRGARERRRLDEIELRPDPERVTTHYYTKLRDEAAVEERESMYVRFSEAIEKALSDFELMELGVITRASRGGAVTKRTTRVHSDGSEEVTETHATGQWTASAWKLERRFPEKYGRRTVEANVSVSVESTGDEVGQESRGRMKLLQLMMRIKGEAAGLAVAMIDDEQVDDGVDDERGDDDE